MVTGGSHNGWNEATGYTDHAELMAYVRKMKPEFVDYVRRDSLEAAAANPTGRKAGYYTDLAHYCAMRMGGKLKGGAN